MFGWLSRCASRVLLPVVLAASAGCASVNVAERISHDAGFETELVQTDSFLLQTYFSAPARATASGLNVYIEGDGLAWRTMTQPSADPTPSNPIGLKLAAADSSGRAVLYVARPCQYVVHIDSACNISVWTQSRFSEAAVAAIDRAIDLYIERLGATSIHLIGYSGGGVIAALLAARRSDVARLTTLAAPLDHAAWTRLHGVSALIGSLNPVDYAAELAHIEQNHFVGSDDAIVPQSVVYAYLRSLGESPMAHEHLLPEFDHSCCWVEWWRELSSTRVY